MLMQCQQKKQVLVDSIFFSILYAMKTFLHSAMIRATLLIKFIEQERIKVVFLYSSERFFLSFSMRKKIIQTKMD